MNSSPSHPVTDDYARASLIKHYPWSVKNMLSIDNPDDSMNGSLLGPKFTPSKPLCLFKRILELTFSQKEQPISPTEEQ